MRTRILATGLAAILLIITPLAAREDPKGVDPDREGPHRRAFKYFQSRKYGMALKVYASILKRAPEDEIALYNTACILALTGKRKIAAATLARAVEAGYYDFDHMERDKDLDPVRNEEKYLQLLLRKEEILKKRSEKQIEEFKKTLGDGYVYDRDEKLNLLVVSKLEEGERERYRASLLEHAQALWKDFFPHKPKRLLSVFLLRDLSGYVEKYGGDKNNAGWYDERNRRLIVNLETGSGTMIHEWTHALHYVDMEALGQTHPMWIIEGFGSLYEHSEDGEDGSVRGRLNWRLTGLTEVLTKRHRAYIPWQKLMATDTDLFYRDETLGTAYAEARYIFYYMQQKKLLKEFYRTYREEHSRDPTGRRTLEEVFKKRIPRIEAEWKRWMLKRRYHWGGMLSLKMRVDLGVSLAEDERGVTVADFEPGSSAGRAGILRDDVIVSVEGREIKDVTGLLALMSRYAPGKEVKITVRRGDKEQAVEVTLGRGRGK
jgi:hypothetical protein